jgi:putative hemolysin
MNKKLYTLGFLIVLSTLILGACGTAPATPTPVPTAGAGMPNPAAVYCEEHGGTSEIITAADGSQSGRCSFPDGSACDEWAYFRGECAPGQVTPVK